MDAPKHRQTPITLSGDLSHKRIQYIVAITTTSSDLHISQAQVSIEGHYLRHEQCGKYELSSDDCRFCSLSLLCLSVLQLQLVEATSLSHKLQYVCVTQFGLLATDCLCYAARFRIQLGVQGRLPCFLNHISSGQNICI